MITFLIVRDSRLRSLGPMVLIVVVIESTSFLSTAAAARLLTRRSLRLAGRGPGRLVRCRVYLIHVAVAVVGHTDLAAIDLGKRRRVIVLHQVLVLEIVVRVVVDVFHL